MYASKARRSRRWHSAVEADEASSYFWDGAPSAGLALHEGVVRFLVEKFRVVLHAAKLDHPAFAVRVFIDILGVILQVRVDLRDLTGHRTVKIRGRLHRLDHAQPCSRSELLTNGRQLEVDDVTPLRLGTLADAHGRPVPVLPPPLARFRESPPS